MLHIVYIITNIKCNSLYILSHLFTAFYSDCCSLIRWALLTITYCILIDNRIFVNNNPLTIFCKCIHIVCEAKMTLQKLSVVNTCKKTTIHIHKNLRLAETNSQKRYKQPVWCHSYYGLNIGILIPLQFIIITNIINRLLQFQGCNHLDLIVMLILD